MCNIITNHFRKRIKQRCKINKKSIDRVLSIVRLNGLRLEDVDDVRLLRYLTNKIDNEIYFIIYGRYMYVVSTIDDVFITVLDLPKKYNTVVDVLIRKKKEGIHNA